MGLVSDTDIAAVKSAVCLQREFLGGVEAVHEATGYPRGLISQAGNVHVPDRHLPSHQILAWDRLAVQMGGQPRITASIARCLGYDMTPRRIGDGCVAASAEKVAASSGKLLGDTLRAVGDGRIDEHEAQLLSAGLSDLLHVVQQMQGAVARYLPSSGSALPRSLAEAVLP